MPWSQTPVVSIMLATVRHLCLLITCGTAAFRQMKNVGFPLPVSPEVYPHVRNYTRFGGSIQSLRPRSVRLQTPVTGLACGLRFRPAS
ncbi:hypothetical protein QUF80_14520 [Desulfococcaceae bacterium HSG8]|nr:hypothetical protein [Desulfococcaceae bacterium HSG8]